MEEGSLYWQVVSSAPESNFTGRFDAVVSGAMILRHTDPQLGPIQLLCPPSAPRRTTRQIYFDRPLYFDLFFILLISEES